MSDMPTPLVNAEWLATNIGRPSLKIFDASYYLPAEKRDAEAEFLAAHLPGAQRFDVDKISDLDSALPHMVPTPARFEKLVSALGINGDDDLIFYDQKGIFSSPRGWWLMRLFGHHRVAVLDGGLPKWRSHGFATESGGAAILAPGNFRARFRPALLRGIGDIVDNLTTGSELILDARSADRFHARVAEPRPGLRSGHIPGSRNLPFNELLVNGQTFLPVEQLRARLAAAGVDGSTKIVTSCGSGVSAAVLSLGIAIAGLPIGGLYDGSWTEWGFATDLPVEA